MNNNQAVANASSLGFIPAASLVAGVSTLFHTWNPIDAAIAAVGTAIFCAFLTANSDPKNIPTDKTVFKVGMIGAATVIGYNILVQSLK